MLFTPLLPSAGPTGGDGEACPAPTISLTIWSFAIAFRAIVPVSAQLRWPSCGDELGGLRRIDLPVMTDLHVMARSHRI
jgi:hypothetical protein